jgi:hypothetical protein
LASSTAPDDRILGSSRSIPVIERRGCERDAEVDPDAYGNALQKAVDDLVPPTTGKRGGRQSDAFRAERGIPPRKEEILRRGAALREFASSLHAQLGED